MNAIPTITKMEVFPVAGHDCMELNLSGAHAPYFTRNIVILTDSTGNEGIGEVPGGEKITAALEQIKDLVISCPIFSMLETVRKPILSTRKSRMQSATGTVCVTRRL